MSREITWPGAESTLTEPQQYLARNGIVVWRALTTPNAASQASWNYIGGIYDPAPVAVNGAPLQLKRGSVIVWSTVPAASATTSVVGGMVKRRRGRFQIEIDGQRFTATSIPALEAMVARWRARKTANDNPRPQVRAPQPEPPKEVVPDLPAEPEHTTAELKVPAVVLPQFGPNQSGLATVQQSLAAQAVLAHLAAVEAAERAERLRREDDDDTDAIMAILEAIA